MWQMKKPLTSLSLMEPGCPLPVVSHQQDPTILIIWTDWLNWHINVWFGRIMWTTQMMFSYWSGQCGMYQGWWGQLWLRGQAQSGDHACAVSPKKWPCTEQTFTKKKQQKKTFGYFSLKHQVVCIMLKLLARFMELEEQLIYVLLPLVSSICCVGLMLASFGIHTYKGSFILNLC